MVRKASRTSAVRKVDRRTAKGSRRAYVRRKKGSKVSCAVCGARSAAKVGKVRLHRRVARPFGGVLCHKCLDSVMRYRARLAEGAVDTLNIPKPLLQFVV